MEQDKQDLRAAEDQQLARHFNELSAAEAERLALLLEELGETQQVIGKILRHGYKSYNPNDPDHIENRKLLERELGDVYAAVELLCAGRDLNRSAIGFHSRVKFKNVGLYLHHQ